MAKRNIAKTAIEGGRSAHNRIAEQKEDDGERSAWRVYCKQAILDEDADEPDLDTDWETGRRVREFKDKLNPVKRWLEAQVNRPWDKVKSDVVSKFDSRSLAGRHILDHINGFVSKPEDKYHSLSWYLRKGRRYPGELYVDERGFLRQEKKISRQKYYRSK